MKTITLLFFFCALAFPISSEKKIISKDREVSLGFAHFPLSKDWKLKHEKEFGNFDTYIHTSNIKLSFKSFGRDFKELNSTVNAILEAMNSKLIRKGKTKFGVDFRILYIKDKNFDKTGLPSYVFLFPTYEMSLWNSDLDVSLVNGLVFSGKEEVLEKEKLKIFSLLNNLRVVPSFQNWKKISGPESRYSMEIPTLWVNYNSFWSHSEPFYVHEMGLLIPKKIMDWKEKPVLNFDDFQAIIESGDLTDALFVPKAYFIEKTEKFRNKNGVDITIYSGKADMEKRENSKVTMYLFVFPLNKSGFGLLVFLGYNGTKLDKEHFLESIEVSK